MYKKRSRETKLERRIELMKKILGLFSPKEFNNGLFYHTLHLVLSAVDSDYKIVHVESLMDKILKASS